MPPLGGIRFDYVKKGKDNMFKNFSVDNQISQRNAALFMAMCAFLWSTSGAMVKYIDWSGTAINFMRSLIAGVLLWVYLHAIGKKVIIKKILKQINFILVRCY